MDAHEFSIPVHDLDAAGKEVSFRVRADWVREKVAADAEEKGDAPLDPHRPRRMGDPIAPASDGELHVRVSKSGTDVVVHGTLQADLQVPCARCLEPATVHIDQPLSVLMVPAGQVKAGSAGGRAGAAAEDDGDIMGDEDVLPYHGDVVVLDDLVRDELLLAVPMIPLCSEDCPGISPPPQGEEKGLPAADPFKPAIDPRLAPLLRFKKES